VVVYTQIVWNKLQGFDWDVANVGHILRHAVSPPSRLRRPRAARMSSFGIRSKTINGEKRRKLFGKTASSREGRRQTRREFARALKDGTVIRTAGWKIAKTDPKVLEQLMEQDKQKATRAISLRVPIADLEQAQRIAAATVEGYQAVLKQAIRAGLKRAG
jgi:hypothetical protein